MEAGKCSMLPSTTYLPEENIVACNSPKTAMKLGAFHFWPEPGLVRLLFVPCILVLIVDRIGNKKVNLHKFLAE